MRPGAWVWFHNERAVSASVSGCISRPIFNVSVSNKRLKAETADRSKTQRDGRRRSLSG